MRSLGNGEKVEVKMLDGWFPAKVIRSAPAARRYGKIYVMYDTVMEEAEENFSSDDESAKRSSKLRAFVDLADVRPAPPPERRRVFRKGEEVEVFTGAAERGWRKGCVRRTLEKSKYLVAFAGEDDPQVVDHRDMRTLRIWDDEFWVPPILNEEHSPDLNRKLRIKRSPYHKLMEGMKVEVMRQNEDEKQDEVWYPAIIIKPLPDESFLVGYLTLRTEEGSRYIMEEVGILDIRPSPPIVYLGMPVGFEQVDGWYSGGWWVGYISQVNADGKYVVCLRNTGEEMVFEHYKLRPHQDFDREGHWNPAPKISLNQAEMSNRQIELKINGLEETFSVGMVVEIRTNDEGYVGSWFPVKIINYIGNGEYTVQYQTLRTNDESQPLEEVASGTHLRPCPPKIEKDDYKVLEEVDAWHNDGWWVGLVSRFIGTSEYAVYFWTTTEELKFGCDQLRPHQDWTCGSWTAAPTPKMLSITLPKQEFSMGMMVEIKSHAYGFVGSWYSARVVSCLPKDKYIVKYETLRTEDDSDFLQETVDDYQIRPCPAPVEKRGPFSLLEPVDVWYNDGWWMGIITQILHPQYTVYFWNSNDEMKFHYRNLRAHQEWTDGNWTSPLKTSNSLMKSKLGRSGEPASSACFCNGDIVEVCSRLDGFHDAWYPAEIIRPMGDGKYLVQYQTVVRDDGIQLLVEEADGSCIRPSPPVFMQDGPFKSLERVDVWYHEGWWVGRIQKVTADFNYLVHVNNTSEVVKFQYEYLRPHLEWLNPEWKSYTKGRAMARDTEG